MQRGTDETVVTKKPAAPTSLVGSGPSMRNPLARLRTALQKLVKHHPKMSVQMASSFCAVAMYPDATLVELEEITELPQQSISRQMMDLGDTRRNRSGGVETGRGPGLGLIESYHAPDDQRAKHYKLTPDGTDLATQIINMIEVE